MNLTSSRNSYELLRVEQETRCRMKGSKRKKGSDNCKTSGQQSQKQLIHRGTDSDFSSGFVARVCWPFLRFFLLRREYIFGHSCCTVVLQNVSTLVPLGNHVTQLQSSPLAPQPAEIYAARQKRCDCFTGGHKDRKNLWNLVQSQIYVGART